MCNIAGYIGTKTAAPILLDMMKKQEGFAGGYYIGLATIQGGKIDYRKMIGHTRLLEETTDVLSLIGTVGICHSRSKGTAGVEWAHPFVSARKGYIDAAYIANGNGSVLYAPPETKDVITKELYDEDYPLYSRSSAPSTAYPHLPDGTSVHISDVMCQLITKGFNEGLPLPKAMERAYIQLPSQVVGLYMHETESNALTYARTNMPIFVAFADHGAYIASSPTAFPEDAGEPQLLPAYSYGRITKDGFTANMFSEKAATVAPIDAVARRKVYNTVMEFLGKGPTTFSEINKNVAHHFEEADMLQKAPAIYEVLYALQKQNAIEITRDFIIGPHGIEVPVNIIKLI